MESREDLDIKERCALCKSMPCCPEHCCNVYPYFSELICVSGTIVNVQIVSIAYQISRVKYLLAVLILWYWSSKLISGCNSSGLQVKNKWRSWTPKRNPNTSRMTTLMKNHKNSFKLKMVHWSLTLKSMSKKTHFMQAVSKESGRWGSRETTMQMRTSKEMKRTNINIASMKKRKGDLIKLLSVLC